jgi:hypothetical protein
MCHHPGIARIAASVAAPLNMIDAPEAESAFVKEGLASDLVHGYHCDYNMVIQLYSAKALPLFLSFPDAPHR